MERGAIHECWNGTSHSMSTGHPVYKRNRKGRTERAYNLKDAIVFKIYNIK